MCNNRVRVVCLTILASGDVTCKQCMFNRCFLKRTAFLAAGSL